MARSTSASQPSFFGMNRLWASRRREPATRLTAARAATIWSLLRKSQLGSSKGAPESRATFVSLSTKISLT
jgi:hypothetical protein